MRWLGVGSPRKRDRLHHRRCPEVAGDGPGDPELSEVAWKVPQPLDQLCLEKGLGPDGLQKFLLQPKLFAEFQTVCWLWLEKLAKSG